MQQVTLYAHTVTQQVDEGNERIQFNQRVILIPYTEAEYVHCRFPFIFEI